MKLFSVVLKNKISIGFSIILFLSTVIVKPLVANEEFKFEIESDLLFLKSEKVEILTLLI